MPYERSVKRDAIIETDLSRAFEAVTDACELREWFCDQAWTDVRSGGRYEVRWRQGYRADAVFAELDKPHHVLLDWKGTGEPDRTTVEFTMEPAAAGVLIALAHTGFGSGAEWDKALAESEKGWATGLENLQSTLETGVDLRSARQAFLGISLDLLDATRAAREGIAVERGIYVLGAVEGSGAEAAGLGKGDVLVALGGLETGSFEGLGIALRAHRAGDVVSADLVRGKERERVQVTLGQRPRQEVPATAGELAQLLAGRYKVVNDELKAAVKGLGDDEAGQRPEEGAWSVKQVLAHLTINERDFHTFAANMALDGWVDAGSSNPPAMPARLAAVLAVEPTLDGLLVRFLAAEAEMVAFLSRLPDEVVTRKARFHRIGQMVLGLPEHTQEHVDQIKDTITAVRSG